MYQSVLADARFYALLHRIDGDIAAAGQLRGCPHCGGRLDSARYPRKPRGALCALGDEYGYRFSFCCAEEGCRRRMTPPSVRFLGRRVYLGAVVVIASVMLHGPSPARIQALHELFGVSPETAARWQWFWREIFVESRTWRAARGMFGAIVDAALLPLSLVERFAGAAFDRLVATLRLLAPLTTGSAGHIGIEVAEGGS